MSAHPAQGSLGSISAAASSVAASSVSAAAASSAAASSVLAAASSAGALDAVSPPPPHAARLRVMAAVSRIATNFFFILYLRSCCWVRFISNSRGRESGPYVVDPIRLPDAESRMLHQPFTAPTVRPLMKYFCTKGYRRMMGPVASMALAILTVSVGRLPMVTNWDATEFFRASALFTTSYR